MTTSDVATTTAAETRQPRRFKRYVSPVAWSVGVILLLIVPFAGFPPIWAAALLLTVVYVPAAVGQNLIIGNAGLLAMGQAAFVGVGAYTAAIVSTTMNLDGSVAILAALITSGALGALVGIPALRISGDYLFIVSLGFNLLIMDVALQWQDVTGGATGFTGVRTLTLFGVDLGVGVGFYVAVVVIVLIACGIALLLTSSRFGLTMEAIRDDEVAAVASGISPTFPKVQFFAVGSALAGLTGALLAFNLGYVGVATFNVGASLLIFQMAVIGGLGTISGSVVGAFIIILLPEILRPLQDIRLLLAGLLIVILMIFRPEGLLGRAKITNLIKK